MVMSRFCIATPACVPSLKALAAGDREAGSRRHTERSLSFSGIDKNNKALRVRRASHFD